MYQISFYVPEKNLTKVKNMMFAKGAGKFNNYENCCWQTMGKGQFKPTTNAKPYIGKKDKLSSIKEYKVEMLCKKQYLPAVITAMKKYHPYEEVAYSVTLLVDAFEYL